MSVNRRDFLRGLLATSAIVISPPIPLPPETGLELLGRGLRVGLAGAVDDDFLAVLKEDAKRFLKPGTVFEIRRSLPMDYGRMHVVAWITESGEMQHKDIGPIEDVRFVSEGGYYYYGRFRT